MEIADRKDTAMRHVFNVAFILAVFAFAGSAYAEELMPATKPIPSTWDWSACKTEIERHCKDKQSNEDIYACLFKYDEDNSKTCDAVHTKYEITTGRK